jgi:eukaryotic-like serine/threonine-protein kinase
MAGHPVGATAAMTLEDRPTLVATLADSTSGLSLAQLRSFLDRQCADDPTLRAEVEALILERETFLEPRSHEPALHASLVRDDIVADRYRITRLIGRGGMGEVYEADDRLLHERVALKTLRADLVGNASLVQRFHEEILLARRVTHPNVCRIFEVGTHTPAGRPPVLFFAMELLEGGTLASRLRSGRLTKDEAFPLAVQMADGLQAAHGAGIVHADFKSGNVVLVPQTGGGVRAVITDFGLARIDPSRVSVDETRTLAELRLAGTLAYMSPEQLRGERLTAASDIYSFGVVLFEMATGSLPFDDRDLIKAAMLKASGEPIPVRRKAPDIDHRWESAIERCLEKDPARRFESAAALSTWFTDRRWFDVWRWTTREWIGAAAALVLTIALAFAGWTWWTRPYEALPAARSAYDGGMRALHSMTYETARKAFERAVAIDPRFALAHAGLARAYDELDYTDRAKDSILRALTASQETRLSSDDERRLRATQFAVSRDYARAAPLFREMERVAAEPDKPEAALEAGWLAQQMEDSEAARAAFERALGFDPSYAAARLRLGFLLGRQGGKDDLALASFTEAEHAYRAAGDNEGVSETLWNRANLLNRRSRARDAVPVIGDALAMTHTVGNRYQEIRLLFLQAAAFRNLGETARATEQARAAIEAAVAENMDNLATSGLIDLGNTYLTVGNYDVAEPYFRRALDTARRSKVRRIEARAQLAMASLCEQDHRPDESKSFAESALSFYRQAGYQRESVQATIVLGGVLQQLGQNDEGVRVLRDALPAAQRLQDRRVEAQLRERIGDNLRDLDEWAPALSEYQRVVEIYEGLEQAGLARVAAAHVLWALGRADEAERSLREAEAFQTKNHVPRLLAAIQAERAEIAYASGRIGDARRLALAALTYFEPRQALDRVWRAQAIVAATANRGEALAAAAAARVTLHRFYTGWPAASVTRYLERRDTKRLFAVLQVGDSIQR